MEQSITKRFQKYLTKKEMEDEKSMCKIIEDIVERECKKARKESQIETACRMIEYGTFTAERIAVISGLSLDEVEELIRKQSA